MRNRKKYTRPLNPSEIIPGIIIRCKNDPSRTILCISGEVYKITGGAQSSLSSKSLINIIVPEDRNFVQSGIKRAINRKQPYKIQYRVLHKSGEIRFLEESGNPVTISESETITESYLHDITGLINYGRNQCEDILTNNTTEELAQTGSWDMDIKTGKSWWSDTFYRICGLYPGEVEATTENALKLIHSDDRQLASSTIHFAIKTSGKFNFHIRIVRPNGEVRFIHSTGKIIAGRNRNNDKLIGALFDETERVLAEKKINRQMNQLKRAEAIGLTGSWEFDFRNNKVNVSDGARKIYELDNREYSILEIQNIPLPIYREILDKELLQLKQKANPYDVRFEIKGKKSGKIKKIHSLAEYDLKEDKVFGIIQDISLYEKNQQKLIDVTAKFQSIANNSIDCIWQMDKRLRFTYLSPSLQSMSGFEPEEWIGTSLHEHTKWKDYIRIARIAIKRMNENSFSGHDILEICMIHKNGKKFPVEITTKTLIDNKGNLLGFQGTTRNISDRVESRNKISELNNRLQIAIEAGNNGIWDWNLETNELYWDDGMFKIYGIDKTSFSNNYLAWQACVVTEDLIREEKKLQRVIKEKGIYNSEFRINLPKKRIKYIKAFAKYVELEHPHLIGTNYDNTQIVENRKKLAESEQQFRQLFEQNNDIIFILNSEGRIINMNSIGLTVFGISSEKVTDYYLTSFIEKEQEAAKFRKISTELKKKNKVPPFYLKMKIRNQRSRNFEASVSPVYKETGELIQIVSVFRDISERLEYEKELKEQTKKAQESDRLKSAFLMNMSHEIRTPLNAMIGFSDILKKSELTVKQREYLSFIQQGGKRLANTVSDILDASLLQKNQFIVHPAPCNLKAILSKAYNDAKELYKSQLEDIRFVFNDSCPDPIPLISDAEQLTSVFYRLLDNAFKFTISGSITMECFCSENFIEINIKDTGIGIEKEKIELIFSFFRQGEENMDRGYDGLGLGLPIIKGILDKLNCRITIISEPGYGTNINIQVPYTQENDLLKRNPFILTEKVVQKKLDSILIVEDDPFSRLFLETVLTPLNLHLFQFSTGRESLNALDSTPFQLAFIDIKLPDISGFELIPRIKQKYPDCKIIIQSAFVSQEDIDEAMMKGADLYLKKPLNPNTISDILEKYFII